MIVDAVFEDPAVSGPALLDDEGPADCAAILVDMIRELSASRRRCAFLYEYARRRDRDLATLTQRNRALQDELDTLRDQVHGLQYDLRDHENPSHATSPDGSPCVALT